MVGALSPSQVVLLISVLFIPVIIIPGHDGKTNGHHAPLPSAPTTLPLFPALPLPLPLGLQLLGRPLALPLSRHHLRPLALTPSRNSRDQALQSLQSLQYLQSLQSLQILQSLQSLQSLQFMQSLKSMQYLQYLQSRQSLQSGTSAPCNLPFHCSGFRLDLGSRGQCFKN